MLLETSVRVKRGREEGEVFFSRIVQKVFATCTCNFFSPFLFCKVDLCSETFSFHSSGEARLKGKKFFLDVAILSPVFCGKKCCFGFPPFKFCLRSSKQLHSRSIQELINTNNSANQPLKHCRLSNFKFLKQYENLIYSFALWYECNDRLYKKLYLILLMF